MPFGNNYIAPEEDFDLLNAYYGMTAPPLPRRSDPIPPATVSPPHTDPIPPASVPAPPATPYSDIINSAMNEAGFGNTTPTPAPNTPTPTPTPTPNVPTPAPTPNDTGFGGGPSVPTPTPTPNDPEGDGGAGDPEGRRRFNDPDGDGTPGGTYNGPTGGDPNSNHPPTPADPPAPTVPPGPTPDEILAGKKRAFTDRVNQSYNNALTYGRNRLRSLGLENDPYGIMDIYTSDIGRRRDNIYDFDPDPNIYWNENISDPGTLFDGYEESFNSILGDTRNRQRRTLSNQFDTRFGGDFTDNLLPDTYDDQFIDNLLSPGYQDAFDQLGRARDRGMLNDTGYTNALNRLNTDRSRARGEVENFSTNLLNTGRDRVRSQLDSDRSRLNEWDFGDTPNFDDIGNRATRTGERYGGTIQGSLSNQFGNRTFFDPTSIISEGRRKQGGGPSNNGTLFDAMQNDELRRSSSTQGAF